MGEELLIQMLAQFGFPIVAFFMIFWLLLKVMVEERKERQEALAAVVVAVNNNTKAITENAGLLREVRAFLAARKA